MPIDSEALNSLRRDRSEMPAFQPARNRRTRWVVGAIGLILLAGALAYWRQSAALLVTVVSVTEGAGGGPASVLNASGYVVARRLATVSSKVTGKVVEVLVEEGMPVTQGQVLARLDDSSARAQYDLRNTQWRSTQKRLEEVKVRLAEAQRQRQRAESLKTRGLVSEVAVDTAQSEVAALGARLASLDAEVAVAASSRRLSEQDLEDLAVRAPFAGVVTSKDAQPGEMVSPVSAGGGFTRTGIATIVDMDSREIEVDVNEAFINRVRAGQRTEAILDAYPGEPLPSHVINIVPTADRQKATVRVRIGFDALDARVLPDMGIKVRFLEDSAGSTGEPARAVARIPAAALIEDGDQRIVWVVKGNTVERRAVRVGAERDGASEVTAGVAPGELLVANAPPGLRDGTRVRIKESVQ